MRSVTLWALAGILAGTSSYAQQPASMPLPSGSAPVAIDPLLVKPVDQLTPNEIAGMQRKLADWPDLSRYRKDNDLLAPPTAGRVVFLGDSITDAWAHNDGNQFFPGKGYLNRGISGQTTPQLLVRFQQDVVDLKPNVVVILAGINDIAGNTGVADPQMIENNFKSMVSIANANNVRVVLSSILPASNFPWRKGIYPAEEIRQLNHWLQAYAAANHCVYLDYYTALVGPDGGMKPGLSKDHVHPTPAGYAIMTPLAQAAVNTALQQR